MEDQNDKFSFKTLWNACMCIVYMALAYLVMFTPLLLPYNFRNNTDDEDDFSIVRIILGISICIYGIIRGYRVIKRKK